MKNRQKNRKTERQKDRQTPSYNVQKMASNKAEIQYSKNGRSKWSEL